MSMLVTGLSPDYVKLSLLPPPQSTFSCFEKLVFVIDLQGTAVFWYNLFPSGEGDYNTRHAACPVLLGNKWGE